MLPLWNGLRDWVRRRIWGPVDLGPRLVTVVHDLDRGLVIVQVTGLAVSIELAPQHAIQLAKHLVYAVESLTPAKIGLMSFAGVKVKPPKPECN